jgi:transposase
MAVSRSEFRHYRDERRPIMATTSYLYHTMGLKHYEHRCTEYLHGSVFHHVRLKNTERTCRGCGAGWHHLRKAGRFTRTFHALPIGRRPQKIVLHGHEQQCRRCRRVLREPIHFARPKGRSIKAFDRFVVELCAIATIKAVAVFLGVGWDRVKGIFKEDLRRRLKKRKLTGVRYIAVDEFAVRKGHRYMTVVMDLETGQILHVAHGKGAEALIPFLKRLRRQKIKLRAVAMDMSPAYMQAVREVFPKLDIVHDPYHIVVTVNRAIDETRKDMYRSLTGEQRSVIKGTRFLLLRSLESLKESALEKLAHIMELNEPLYQAYLLKEEMRWFWNLPSAQAAEQFLQTWTEEAYATGLKRFHKLADSLLRHKPGLLSYFSHRISTGPLEGLNNKIKVLKRQAYGFRDDEYFKLRLYFLHDDTPAFAG